ncbi:hypothetical protein AK812_SmicGene36529 [Symbiodinium microadriaticum]|uniref:Uncharacterized protein n=1 Tax=Symbiodinium microadriaticum TaxID=2951 RepID=A0A1Q9CIL4_SYMMI|nr:hypothetical protein AK812_SmicGene36529 [Symbiodinium microadriaticum]
MLLVKTCLWMLDMPLTLMRGWIGRKVRSSDAGKTAGASPSGSGLEIQLVLQLGRFHGTALGEVLEKARNGVLPGQKVRSALAALNQSSKLNHGKKTDKDGRDLVDEGIRMCLSHLRSLTNEVKKIRAFRKLDVHSQDILQGLLQRLRVPETQDATWRAIVPLFLQLCGDGVAQVQIP